MPLSRTLIFGAVFIVATASSHAELTKGPLTWSELVEKVKTSNEELQASERRLVAANHRISVAQANYYPQLSATASRTQTGSRASNTAEEYSLALNASQNLFAGFQDQATIAIQKATLESAQASLQAVKAKVSYDLKVAMASLIYSQSYMKLSQNIIQRRELNLRLVQLRFDAGRENKGSLLLSRAYLEEAKLDHLEAEQNLIVAQGQLAKVLGQESAEPIVLADRIPTSEAPAEPSEENFKRMVEQTPNYKVAIAEEKTAEGTLTQAKSGFYPSLNLTASAGQAGPSWYPEQDRWSLGLNLTLPLFNGGRDYYATQGYTESLQATRINRGVVLKDQLVALKNAFGNYAKIIQRLKVDRAHVIAAELREKISRQKYNNGLSTFDDWDTIETELIKRQKNFISSERDRIVSEAAWEQSQGKGVFNEL